MSNMKNIEIGLNEMIDLMLKNIDIGFNEMIDLMPQITLDYEMEFFVEDIKVYNLGDDPLADSSVEVTDLSEISKIISRGFSDRDFDIMTNVENTPERVSTLRSLILDQGSVYNVEPITRYLTIPLYYKGNYYKIVLDAPAVLERDKHLVMHKPVKYANLRKPRVRK